jgi:hypothetical protein
MAARHELLNKVGLMAINADFGGNPAFPPRAFGICAR